MERRTFIKSLAAVAGLNTLCSGSPLSLSIKPAHAANGKSIITVFQRGGCDGLNCVVPYFDGRYYDLRPTIAIQPPESGGISSALDLNGSFGLHPALNSFHALYQTGRLAIFPTVHYPDASRSHFQSQFYIESAHRVEQSDGWLNRHLQTQSSDAPFRAVGFGNELAQALRGSETAASLTSLQNYHIGLDEAEETLFLQKMRPLYKQQSTSNNESLLNRFGVKVFDDLELIEQVRQVPYVPSNNANYPNSGLGRQLKEIAQLLKLGLGLEAATINSGGWDTHTEQGAGSGRQANALADFSNSINAFISDLGPLMNDVVLLTSTEFGRTAQENGSGGTDHGYASTWYAIGGDLKGGIYGDWPGLASSELRDGRYLDTTVDYRDIYAEILTNHLSNHNLSELLPDHNVTSLGLFDFI